MRVPGWPGRGEGGYSGKRRDKAANTAQAAKGTARRVAGKAAENRYAQAVRSGKKASLVQAGEKPTDTAKK